MTIQNLYILFLSANRENIYNNNRSTFDTHFTSVYMGFYGLEMKLKQLNW